MVVDLDSKNFGLKHAISTEFACRAARERMRAASEGRLPNLAW
jgi:hypothetical protein